MKKMLAVLCIATIAFAGKKEIGMLNQQVLALEEMNRDLKTENKALTQSNQVFEAQVTKLSKELEEKTAKIDELSRSVETLQKQLKQSMSSQPTTVSSSNSVSAAGYSPFPITSSIQTKKAHDAQNLAVLLSFYNGAAESISGFNAKLTFSQFGQPLLTCNVQINKALSAGENVTWYGAIPYNSTDGNNVRFYNADTSTITVSVEVTSVILTNGVVRNYK